MQKEREKEEYIKRERGVNKKKLREEYGKERNRERNILKG
jgi:hypothetical protein